MADLRLGSELHFWLLNFKEYVFIFLIFWEEKLEL